MPRGNPRPWFRPSRNTWYATVGGRQVNLKTADKDEAFDRWHELMARGDEQPCVEGMLVVDLLALYAEHDQVGTSTAPIDPLLGPLADQGGFNWSMPFFPGSPAIDRGVLSGAPTTDHRGLPRPYGGGVDIGSFELQDSAPVAQNGNASVNEDSLVEGQLVATDPEGSTLTFSLVDGPQHGTAFVAEDGAFLYIPNADYNGSDEFTFKASDGGFDSNVATIGVTVRPINDLQSPRTVPPARRSAPSPRGTWTATR